MYPRKVEPRIIAQKQLKKEQRRSYLLAIAARSNGQNISHECTSTVEDEKPQTCEVVSSPEVIAEPVYENPVHPETEDTKNSECVPMHYDWKRLDSYAKVMELHETKRQLAEKRCIQEQTRRDLDKQVEDLRARKEAEKRSDAAYFRNVNTGLEQWRENDLRVAQEKLKKAESEKLDHLEQLKFDESRKKETERKHRQEDSHILAQVEKELLEEQEQLNEKRKKEKDAFQRLMKENEIGRMQKLNLKKQKIQDELKMMEEYKVLMEAQQRERDEELEHRLSRQKFLVKRMEENVTKRLNEKANDDNVRALKQQAEQDARSIEIETFKLKKYQEMKANMIRTLEEQVAEKLSRQEEEDEIKNMHAEILKLDTVEFGKYEAQRRELTKKLHAKYKEQLLRQIAQNKQRDKAMEECMNAEEIKINRDLIQVVEKTLHEDEIKSGISDLT